MATDFLTLLKEVRGTGAPEAAYADGIYWDIALKDYAGEPGMYGHIAAMYNIIEPISGSVTTVADNIDIITDVYDSLLNDGVVTIDAIVDGLTSIDPTSPLSANQGRVLAEAIQAINVLPTEGMLKSTYDVLGNGVVDDSEKVNGLTVETAVPTGALFTDTNTETTTSLSLATNVLSYVDELGATTNLDLSLYLDDTNLAYITSGVLDGDTGIATFTRSDTSTFTVDLSTLLGGTSVTVNNTLTSISTTEALSAAQGKVLKDVQDTQQTAIDLNTAKVSNVDHPLVETSVPLGAVFTDTLYDDTDVLKDNDTVSPVTPTNKIMTETDVGALGGGDMLKSVYDTNNDGKVNSAVNSDTVNGLTVETAVPLNAIFTDNDTIYDSTAVDSHVADAGLHTDTIYDDSNVLKDSDTVSIVTVSNKLLTQTESYTHPSTHPPSIIEQDANNRFVTDTEIITWNAKQDAIPVNTYQPYDVNTVIDSSYVHTDNNLTNILKSSYDTAVTWGNHALAGYLTSYTETDPVFTAWDKSTGISITESQISDFGTYLTAETSHATVAETDSVNVFSAAQKGSLATVTYGASVALDMNASNNFAIVLTGNITLANPTNITADQMQGGVIKLTQDATGGRTLTLGTNWKLIGTDDADTTLNKVNIYQYTVIDPTNILLQFVSTL